MNVISVIIVMNDLNAPNALNETDQINERQHESFP